MFSAAGAERSRGENGKMRLHRCGHVLRDFQAVIEMKKKKKRKAGPTKAGARTG